MDNRGSVDIDVESTVRFRWDYAPTSDATRKLYSQAKQSNWDPETSIDWSVDVQFDGSTTGKMGRALSSLAGESDMALEQRNLLARHTQAWMLSQLLHGEQGALIGAARLVETAPELDWKLCAAGQALDEAKHVEVFSRYLESKLGCTYPINAGLEALLLDIARESRWDMTYLGLQVLVEGFALGSFALARMLFFEPLAGQITDYVLRDEARHVAFGMVALEGVYPALTSAERSERMDFVRTSLSLLRSRFRMDDVWERAGIAKPATEELGLQRPLRRKAMSRIPPLLKRLGLWDESIAKLLEVD